jgi:hypothetical protein
MSNRLGFIQNASSTTNELSDGRATIVSQSGHKNGRRDEMILARRIMGKRHDRERRKHIPARLTFALQNDSSDLPPLTARPRCKRNASKSSSKL